MSDKRAVARSPEQNALFRSGDPDFMTSLARGLAVIRVFRDGEHRRLTIADVSRLTGLSRGVVRRCLHTLTELGYIGSEGRRFFLEPKVLTLGYGYVRTASLPLAAQPFLDALSHRLHEPSWLAVMDEDDVVTIARGQEPVHRLVSITLNVGSRVPAYCTAVGRVLLAHLPEAALEAYLERVQLIPRTERTVSVPADLVSEVERVRRDAYALVDREYDQKIRSIAVPVHNVVGEVIAAMTVVFQGEISRKELIDRVLPALQGTAVRLKERLGSLT